jgi:tetratricopeptide (TPR) repeat protein
VVRNAPLAEQRAQGALQHPDASRAAQLTLPFVGRDAEMQQLRALWSRAARGRGGLAFVSGEAGIGKTRLVNELALLVESEGGRVAYGGTSYPEAAPYQCLADALRSALPLVAALELDPIWLAVIAQIVPELRTRVPDLPELPATDPARDRLRLFEGIARGLEALARSRPLLVILEDLHWAGEATLAAARFAARRAAVAAILIVGTYREEEAPRTHPLRRLRRELNAERIVAGLSPARLSPVFIAEMIAALPQASAIDGGAARSLYEQSEGNPLFLTQLVRDRLESHGPEREPLHGGIKDIIETRIARLTERTLAFAGFAAVVGQGFDAEVVAELSGWEQHEVFEALSELIDRHLVQEAGGRGRAAYSFTHHLIQATVYEGMDEQLRMRRHQRLAHVLADIASEDPGHASSEIARHHDLGGEPVLAVAAHLAAARHAIALHADEDALRYVGRLLELGPSVELRAHALLLREAILGRRGDRAGQERDLDELDGLAESGDDEALRCEALYRRIARAHSLGERDAEAALISRLQRRAAAAGDPRWKSAAALARATHAAQVDNYEIARESAADALASYEALGDVPGQVESLCVLAHVAANRGALDEAKALLERARGAALAHGNAGLVGRALLSASGTALLQHNFAECIALCEEAIALYRSIGDREGEADALVRAASAYARLSRFDKTNERATAALEIFDAIGKRQGQATVLINRGILAVRLGAFDAAAEAMSRARAIFDALHDKRGITVCDINLAAVKIWQGKPDEGAALARQALALARSIKLPAYEAAALANVGTAERNLGNFKAAIEHLEASLRLRRKVKRPADAMNDLADLVIAYLRARDLKGALRTAKVLQSHGDQWLDAALWPQYCYWAAAQAYHAADKTKEAKAALVRAGAELDTASAAIENPDDRAAFARLPFNEEIGAARERGLWPRY